ncbi:MAG: hypothetical protein QXU20_04310 [Candidatus Woesearchaeota archaeon]
MTNYREGLTEIIEREIFDKTRTFESYKERIQEFRRKGYNSIYEVAIFLKEIIERKYDKSKISPTINSNLISKIIFGDETENHTKNILKRIEREYGGILEFFNQEGFLKYDFKFYENLKNKGYSYSMSDIRRQIIVPEILEGIDYFILGTIVGDGKLEKNKKDIHLVVLQGEKSDYKFYNNVLKDLLSRRFNINAEIMDVEKHGVRIDLCSKLIYTWVERNINFPNNKKNLEFSLEVSKDKKLSFLAGIVATSAKIERTGIVIEHKYEKIIRSTGNLLESLNINYCYGKNILDAHKPYNIIIPKNEVLKIADERIKIDWVKDFKIQKNYGYFLNPKHFEGLKKNKMV